jgi:putative Mg2+ transporter-C (MgtC) family protein
MGQASPGNAGKPTLRAVCAVVQDPRGFWTTGLFVLCFISGYSNLMIPIGSVAFPAAGVAALNGDGWRQAGELGLALVLSAAIGLEREVRQKNAGLRTHTLVGVGAALFMLVSKYGFTDVLVPRLVVLDPSRVAAQIVTGVGFLGAGLIFVRRDSVRGLTTAAAIWVTAAVGAASGSGLPILAALTTATYFLVALGFPLAVRRLPRSATAISALRVRYPDGRGILRDVLREATMRGFAIDNVETQTLDSRRPGAGQDVVAEPRTVEVTLQVHGRQSVNDLAAELSELQDVYAVLASDANASDE